MLVFVFITALALYGTKVLWQEGMILHPFKCKLDKVFGRSWIRKPLYACPPCMSSVWGSALYWLTPGHGTIIGWITFILATCAATWILLYQFPFDD